MLFDVWGSNTGIHWLGWAMVFIGLIVLNEVGRRSKAGAAIIFVVAPLAMTIYCIAIAVGVANEQESALTNPTHVPEQLVPLRQGLCRARRMLGFYCHQVPVGQAIGKAKVVPRMAVCHRGHQHHDRCCVRL